MLQPCSMGTMVCDILQLGALFLFLTVPALTSGTNTLWDKYWVRTAQISSLVHNDYLYLSGGLTTVGSKAHPHYMRDTEILGSTLRIDLSSYWTTSNVTATYSDKPRVYPYARMEMLWADDSYLYAYGGIRYAVLGCGTACHGHIWKAEKNVTISPGFNNKLQSLSTLAYKVRLDSFGTSKEWEGPLDFPPLQFNPIQGALGTVHGNKYYSLGGFGNWPYYATANSDENVLPKSPGMVSWNLDGSGWQNDSSTGYKPGGAPSLGAAVPTPFGPDGTILYLGGYTPMGHSFSFSFPGERLQDLSQIPIYDIKSGEFTRQTATGSIPQSRFSNCAVGVSDSESGSFDIFLYGGTADTTFNSTYTTSMATLYALSLPSFVWTVVDSPASNIRVAPTCQVVGQNQMMVIGGTDPTDFYVPGESPDPWPNGIGLFDLHSWEWKEQYNPKASPYKRHEKLTEMSKKTPFPKKWDSDLAEMLFHPAAKPYHLPVKNKNSSGGASNHMDVGAIVAGSVVGGIALVAIVGISLCLWRRRTKNKNVKRNLSESSGESKSSNEAELPGYEAHAPVLLDTKEKPGELSGRDKSLPPTPSRRAELESTYLCELPTALTKSCSGSTYQEEDTNSSIGDDTQSQSPTRTIGNSDNIV